MNRNFSEYSTSTAFLVNLTKRQCNTLLRLRQEMSDIDRLYILGVDCLRPLDAKGLVFWHREADDQAKGFGGLTKAGELMADLLIEAGLTIEGTNTVSILKREGWQEERKARQEAQGSAVT